jgi:hypothetical protein
VAHAGKKLMSIAFLPGSASSKEQRRSFAAHARTEVLWIGGAIPKSLCAALMVRFNILPVPAEPLVIDTMAPNARALLIEVRPETKDLAWADCVIDVALEHGLLVVFTTPEFCEDDNAGDIEARNHCFNLTKAIVKPGRVRACFSDCAKIETAVALHDPKGGCNRSLDLSGDPRLDASAETLIRRAFHDFEGITLERLQGGKSGAGVWIVRPSVSDRRRRAAPFLVKWNALDKMRAEHSNVTQYACNTVSFRLTPPLHVARCIEGSATALLVFDFIDRAIPFATAIRSFPAGQLIGSLFDHTLAGCLAIATDCVASVLEPYEQNGVLRWTEDLRAAAAKAQALDSGLPSSEALRERLRRLAPVSYRIGTVHGDMHVLNLLVAAGSSDVLLIDFGKIMYNMPVIADAACLEVSLTFPPNETRPHLGRSVPTQDVDWLEHAYTYPMDPHAVPPRADDERWLPEVLRAIRGAARQHDPSTASYATGVLTYLLRYASYGDSGSLEDRALAYRLASRLAGCIAATLDEHPQHAP